MGLTTGIAGASQLPNKWTRPVINAVFLPTHAQTTETPPPPPPPPPPAPTDFRDNIILVQQNVDNSAPTNVLSVFVPDAHAGQNPGSLAGDICISSPDGTSFTAKLLYDIDGSHYHEASGTVGGGPVSFPQAAGTAGCFMIELEIEVISTSAGGAEYLISNELTAAGLLGEGNGCPSNPGGGCEVDS